MIILYVYFVNTYAPLNFSYASLGYALFALVLPFDLLVFALFALLAPTRLAVILRAPRSLKAGTGISLIVNGP